MTEDKKIELMKKYCRYYPAGTIIRNKQNEVFELKSIDENGLHVRKLTTQSGIGLSMLISIEETQSGEYSIDKFFSIQKNPSIDFYRNLTPEEQIQERRKDMKIAADYMGIGCQGIVKCLTLLDEKDKQFSALIDQFKL